MKYQITGVATADVCEVGVTNNLQKAIETAKIFAAHSVMYDHFKITDKDGNRIVTFDTQTLEGTAK